MAGDRAGVLANLDDEMVLARLAAGEHAVTIADELGVHKSAISHRFSKRPEYLKARESGAEVRLETAEHEIEAATDPFNLARARERFRAVAWRCEREFPHRWGAHTQVSVTVDLGSELQQLSERLSKAPQQTLITDGITIEHDDNPLNE